MNKLTCGICGKELNLGLIKYQDKDVIGYYCVALRGNPLYLCEIDFKKWNIFSEYWLDKFKEQGEVKV